MVNVIIAKWQGNLEEARRANLLREPKVAVGDSITRAPARYDVSVGERLSEYLQDIPDSRSERLVILAGMSQMYAINERRPGDETISERMDDMLRDRGARVFGLAAPNLDNEEAMLLLLAALARPKTAPAVFIYALCFDKMRFVDLRPGYLAFLRENGDVAALWAQTAAKYRNRFPLATAKMEGSLASLTERDAAQEQSFEHRLRQHAGIFVPVVRMRKELNGYVLYDILYPARNKLLGIKNTSKRPIIAGRYDLNKELLLMMVDVAKSHNVQFVAYINPLNPQADNPYVPDEYETFKRWAKAMADSSGIPFANLENVVPHEDWGLFMGGPDFKHFKGAGHLRTARAVVDAFEPVLVGGHGSVFRGAQK